MVNSHTRGVLLATSCLMAMVLIELPAAAQAVEPAALAQDLSGDAIPKDGVLRFGTSRFRTPVPGADVYFAGPSTLATYCPDRRLVVHEWPSGKLRFRVSGKDEAIRSVVPLGATGKLLVAIASGEVSVVDTATGKRESSLESTAYETVALAVSNDGKEAACGDDLGKVHLRALPEGKETRVIGNGVERIVVLAYATSSKFVALDRAGKARLWDRVAEKPALEFVVPAGSTHLVVSPDGMKAWVAGGSRAASCWSLADGSRLLSVEADPEETRCLAMSPDGALVLTGGRDGRVRAWNATDGKNLWSAAANIGWIGGLRVSPDGKAVVCFGEDTAARVLDASSGADAGPTAGHSASVNCIALSPDGRTLATGAADRSVRLWNVDTSKQIACFSEIGGAVNALAWAPSGASIAVVAGKEIVILEASGDLKRTALGGGLSGLRSVAWCGEAGIVTGGTDTLVRLWNLKDGKSPREFAGHDAMVIAMSASPDGQHFVTGGTDGKSAIWNLATGAPTWLPGHPRAVSSIAFSKDGRFFATGCADRAIRLWETATGKPAGVIRGFDGTVTGVAFSPDGTRIAAAALGNSVRVCEIPGGREVVVFHGTGGSVNGVCWTSDGKRVISAMQDTTAIAWRVGQ